jgi:hypothetical protein
MDGFVMKRPMQKAAQILRFLERRLRQIFPSALSISRLTSFQAYDTIISARARAHCE